MKEILSKIVFGLSCLAVALLPLATLIWFSAFIDHDGRGAFGFLHLVTFMLGGGSLLLAVIAGSILVLRGRARRDSWSLFLSGASFLIVLVETVALSFVPLHGPY
jgi:hypothetical protein